MNILDYLTGVSSGEYINPLVGYAPWDPKIRSEIVWDLKEFVNSANTHEGYYWLVNSNNPKIPNDALILCLTKENSVELYLDNYSENIQDALRTVCCAINMVWAEPRYPMTSNQFYNFMLTGGEHECRHRAILKTPYFYRDATDEFGCRLALCWVNNELVWYAA